MSSPSTNEVWLDQAPHLLEVGWKLPATGRGPILATEARSVVKFFSAASAPVKAHLHGSAVGSDGAAVSMGISINGCEAGNWTLTSSSSEGVFEFPASCVHAGINGIEFEPRDDRARTGTLGLESLSIETFVPAEAPPGIAQARAGKEIRASLVAATPTIETALRVEEPCDLLTGVGLSGRGWSRSEEAVRVRIQLLDPKGKERTLFDRTLGRMGEGVGKWQPVKCALAPDGDGPLTLRMTRERVAPAGGRAEYPSFADPAMFVSLEKPVLVPGRSQEEDPPPVVIVVFDSLRADHLPIYGYGRPTAPNLESFARESVLFRSCLAHAPWTLPSITSLLTGLYPGQHLSGLRRPLESGVPTRDPDFISPFRTFRSVMRLSQHVATLAETMSAAGYLCAGITESSYLSERSDLSRGFSYYLTDFDLRDRSLDPTARRLFFTTDAPAREWITEHARARVFLLRHYLSPHLPFMAIPGEERFVREEDEPGLGDYFDDEKGARADRYGAAARRRIADLYDESIRLADGRFGDLIAALKENGLYERALILVTSDHGVELWDHGGFGEGHTLYGELLNVPLIVKLPNEREAGRVVAAPARLIDVVPTVLKEAGVAAPGSLAGRALFPLEERGSSAGFESLAESPLYGPRRRMARKDALELILTDRRAERLVFGRRPVPSERAMELFDAAADPRQRKDLSGTRPELVASMKAHLEEIFRKTRRSPIPHEVMPELSREELEQLQRLGYVGAGATSVSAREEQPPH